MLNFAIGWIWTWRTVRESLKSKGKKWGRDLHGGLRPLCKLNSSKAQKWLRSGGGLEEWRVVRISLIWGLAEQLSRGGLSIIFSTKSEGGRAYWAQSYKSQIKSSESRDLWGRVGDSPRRSGAAGLPALASTAAHTTAATQQQQLITGRKLP